MIFKKKKASTLHDSRSSRKATFWLVVDRKESDARLKKSPCFDPARVEKSSPTAKPFLESRTGRKEARPLILVCIDNVM